MDSIPDSPLLAPGRAARYLAFILGLAALLIAAATALPHNPYIRYQQFANGDFGRARWVYERIHYDPTPIDVAVIGSSRIEAAVSAPKLEAALSRQLGRPIHVAGLAVPMEGRDAHFAIAQDLFRTRPETRLVVVSVVEPIRFSHPAFKNIGNTGDVLAMPMWLNYYWLDNAAYLPYRNLSLFIQGLVPRLFGVSAEFDPAHYARYGTQFDTSQSFRLDNGALIDRDKQPSKAVLDAAAAAWDYSRPSRLARVFGADDNILEHDLSARIATLARQHCAGIVFLHLPTYRGDPGEVERAFYEGLGPLLLTPPAIGSTWTDFADAGHLRRAGIDKVTAWLPTALAPYLEPLRTGSRCPTGD